MKRQNANFNRNNLQTSCFFRSKQHKNKDFLANYVKIQIVIRVRFYPKVYTRKKQLSLNNIS